MGRIHSTITTGTGPADRSRSPTRSRSATPRLSDSVPSRTTACDPWQPGRHPPILVHDAKPEGTISRFRPPAPTNKRSGEAPRADLGSGRPTGAPKSLKIHQSARPRLKQKQLMELFAPGTPPIQWEARGPIVPGPAVTSPALDNRLPTNQAEVSSPPSISKIHGAAATKQATDRTARRHGGW
jgi:hypothetical protein